MLRVDLLLDRAAIVALVEETQVEVPGRARRPQAERVHGVGLVTDDERVVRNADDGPGVHPVHAQAPVVVVSSLRPSPHADDGRVLHAGELPGVAVLEPVVVPFDLAAVLHVLDEDAEVVPNAVAHRGERQRRQGIHETRRQSSQSPVAEPRVPLLVEDGPEVEAPLRSQRLGCLVETQVEQAETEASPGQKLRREVVGPLHVAFLVGALGGQPSVNEPIPDGMGQGLVEVGRRRSTQLLGAGIEKMVQHRALEGGRVHPHARGRRGLPSNSIERTDGGRLLHDPLVRKSRAEGSSPFEPSRPLVQARAGIAGSAIG